MDLLMVLRKATFSVAVVWVIGMLLAIHSTRQFYLYKMRRIDEPKSQFDRTLRPIFHTSRKNSFDVSDSLASKGDGLKFGKSSENRSTFIDDGNILYNNELPYIQTGKSDVYMFSAVQIQSGDRQYKEGWTVNGVVVNGWEKRNSERSKFLCCYYLSNGSVSSVYSRRKRKTWNEVLRPVLYVCPVVVEFSHLRGVSISLGDSCSTNKNNYIKPVFQIESIKSEIAVCAKLAYFSVSAEQILEWFEVQRLLGVSKILTYTYRLNFEALKVLKYYESIGLATVYDFDFPEKDKYPRNVGQHNNLAWSDLQIIMNDCCIRLYGYKYVMVLDKDEFMIPNVTKYGFDLKLSLDNNFLGNTAGITMHTKMHMTSWNPTNQSSTLFLGKYINSTTAIYDRSKNVFMPTRVSFGSVSVHNFSPAPRYGRRFLQETEISLHHYRKCRTNYWFEKGIRNMTARELSVIYENKAPDKKCFGFRQYDSPDVRRVIHAVESNVLKLRSELNV